ncbi:MAG: hypothetical protein MRJ93_12915 [Nitrososphaeraceae archaeon]|nr:hypothetical protein [Nitrososphaeraceae archaeon]
MSSSIELVAIADCTIEDAEHEWESIGYFERVDNSTVAVEYECLNCGKTDFQYYEDITTEQEKDY